jgi:integrase
MKNLRQEMRTCVFNAFHEGTKKREMKAQGLGEDRVFSHTSAGVLLDRITDFSKFCKSCGINRLAKVTPKIAREYLESKVYTCSQKTVNEYRSELIKLGKICKVDLECEKVYVPERHTKHRGAQAVISRNDFAQILDYCRSHPSKSGVCIMLEKEIGVRVSDIAYGIKVDEQAQKLHIRCKNGKWLDRQITPPIRDIMALKPFQEALVGDKFRPVKDNSINKQLRRIEDKLGLEHHSFHDIRRRVAQDKYDELRASGLSRSECLTAVSIWLNHGRNREKLMLRSYIADAW